MPVPNSSVFPTVLATWPVLPGLGDPDSTNSPWQAIRIPESPSPLTPVVSILFNHAINPSVYASDEALSGYVFLTSLTDPSATNVTQFTDVAYDQTSNVLSFCPATDLTAGARYGATLRNTLRDANGRGMINAYYWEFEIDPSAYQGAPVPVLMGPANQTVVVSVPFSLIWGLDSSYTDIPSGASLGFEILIASDPTLQETVWTGTVAASGGVTLGPFTQYGAVPLFADNELTTPALYYWSVRAVLTDVSLTVVGQSAWATANSFFLDDGTTNLIPSSGGAGGESWPTTVQLDPLIPTQAFRILGVSPRPGSIAMDGGPS